MISWILNCTPLVRNLRRQIDALDLTIGSLTDELDQADQALRAMTADRDAIERELQSMSQERDMALYRIDEWETTRTTGGPARPYTTQWRNVELPRVETAAPLEAES